MKIVLLHNKMDRPLGPLKMIRQNTYHTTPEINYQPPKYMAFGFTNFISKTKLNATIELVENFSLNKLIK